jgi:hypothetical protein
VLLLALVIAAKGSASAAIAPAGPAVYNTIAAIRTAASPVDS